MSKDGFYKISTEIYASVEKLINDIGEKYGLEGFFLYKVSDEGIDVNIMISEKDDGDE